MRRPDLPAYLLLRGFARAGRDLSPGDGRRIASTLAWLAGEVLRLRRDVVDSQLAACFPALSDPARRRLARDVYRHLALTIVEVARDPGREPPVRIEPGWEPLASALAPGRGAIVAAAHLGNFELGGRVLARRCRLLDVVKPLHNRRIDRWLQRERERHGIATVTVDGAAPAVLAHLRSGGVVSLVLDQDAGASGVRLPFLGREASAWPGAARFSLQTGCPVVPMGIVRDPDGGHVLHIAEPMWPADRPGDEEGVRAYAAEISAAVERFILIAPEQWFWVHRRWKEVDGSPSR